MDHTILRNSNETCSTFYLEGLNCAHCAGKIEDSLKNNENFNSVNFSFATKKLVIEASAAGVDSLTIITDTVNSIEDGVTVVSDNAEEKEDNQAANHRPDAKTLLNEHKVSLLGLLALVITMSFGEAFAYRLPGYLLAYILIGGDVAYGAFRNISKGQIFDENFLMTIATFGAFALGEYFEAVAVMLFYKIGEGFQDYAVDHTRRSIKSLLNIKAEFANRLDGDNAEKVDPKVLDVGDRIIIKPGEKIPVDATIIEGTSSIDTSALTGESLPVSVASGDQLLSGAINIDSTLTAIVDKTFSNSTVAKILDMVENATGKKAKTEQFITKFAKVYTPIVVFSAVLLAIVPPLLGFGAYRDWISRSLIFLVISCPCALVLSVPLGYFGGLGAASRLGILVKGGNYLEALNTVDTLIFDKTGTLTKGNFSVVEKTSDETLELAAYAEQHSNHPIAKSIVNAYGKPISMKTVTEVIEVPGEGLTGQYKNKSLLVGNSRLMNRYNIDHETSQFIGSVVHVAYDDQFIGSLHIADEIKSGSRKLATELQQNHNKKLMILTGDQRSIAEAVASEIGIANVESELMPGDKLSTVERLIDQGSRTMFVGDGINDAPVLARADIGVAMGGVGSDAAIEAADMVIMNDDPSKVITAIRIAKRTRNIVLQNIVFALAIKLFFLSLGAAGQANMYQAIFADVGVALLAVLNSMRTLRIKE